MGRFDALEFGEAERQETAAAPAGEAVQDAQYFIDLGERYFYRTAYEPALKAYSRAAGLDPGAEAAWLGQILSLTALQEFREAELWYGNAAEAVGDSPDLLAARAQIAARIGDFDRACGYSDASLAAEGAGAFPHVVRGEIFLYGGRNAEYCFDRACALARSHRSIRLMIADACVFSGRRPAAHLAGKYLQAAVDAEPQSPELVFAMGRALLAAGRRRAARTAFEQAQALDPALPEIAAWIRRAKPGCLYFWSK